MTESRHAFLRLSGTRWRTHTVDATAGTIEQRLTLRGEPGTEQPVLRFRGRLDRPAFAEITEVSPLPPTGATTELRAEGNVLRVEVPGLPALAEIIVAGAPGAWLIEGAEAHLVVAAVEMTITCTLSEP